MNIKYLDNWPRNNHFKTFSKNYFWYIFTFFEQSFGYILNYFKYGQ